MLKEMGQKAVLSTGVSCLSAVDYMDDGSRINLKIQIDVNEGKAGNNSEKIFNSKYVLTVNVRKRNVWFDKPNKN